MFRTLIAGALLLLAAESSAWAGTITTTGGIVLTMEGRTGSTVPSNLGNTGGTTPFALDQLGLGIHLTANINNGLYGNSNSWIGNGATGVSGPYVGLSFVGTKTVNSIAFGRDNLANPFFDRNAGTYTVQYRNDGSIADDLGWTSIGNITYAGAANATPYATAQRNVYSFAPVNATAMRLIVPASGIGAGTAIDEFEAFSGSSLPPAPPTLVATGGTYGANNIALSSKTAIAFAQDQIGVAPHNIPNLNNGTYGNSSSWIGANTGFLSSTAGVNLNGKYTIDSVAFGRDNTGTFSDRSQGAYTIQYTTVSNPDATTPDTAWTSLGVVAISASPATRRQFSFAPVSGVTGVRIVTNQNTLAIDELEVTGTGTPTFTLISSGIHSIANKVPVNDLALASRGVTPFAKDVIPGFPTRHTIPGINDGNYGNNKSWIGNSATSFIGVNLHTPRLIGQAAWGRDNGGDESPDFAAGSAFTDRTLGLYTLQYTLANEPNELTPDNQWITIGLLNYDGTVGSSTRNLWNFAPVLATGFRLLVPNGAAIDEFELFSTPEPASMMTWGLVIVAGGGAAAWRRRCGKRGPAATT